MLIANGHGYNVPGRVGTNFRMNKKLALTAQNDWRKRRRDEVVMSIVLHTRLGIHPVKVKAGVGPNKGWDLDLAQRFSKDDRAASAHIAVDADGSYACMADLATIATYHASHMNGISVGIEIYQDVDGTVYEASLEAAADIVDVLTCIFGIQRQVPVERAICRRFANIVPGDPHTYIQGGNRGRDWVGVLGHRNLTRNRGLGDPGDPIFEILKGRGYEAFKVDDGEDIKAWVERQLGLGMHERDVDGVPEMLTRRQLMFRRNGGPGLWVERPADEDYDPELEHPAE